MKNSEVIEHLMDIKEDVAGIRGHLKTLNGSVKRHEDAISINTKDIDNSKLKLARWGGAFVVIIAIVQFLIQRFL